MKPSECKSYKIIEGPESFNSYSWDCSSEPRKKKSGLEPNFSHFSEICLINFCSVQGASCLVIRIKSCEVLSRPYQADEMVSDTPAQGWTQSCAGFGASLPRADSASSQTPVTWAWAALRLGWELFLYRNTHITSNFRLPNILYFFILAFF